MILIDALHFILSKEGPYSVPFYLDTVLPDMIICFSRLEEIRVIRLEKVEGR